MADPMRCTCTLHRSATPTVADPVEGCPFCAIIAGEAPATVVARWDDAIAFVPLNPVTPGHILVVPLAHVDDFTADPDVTAATMRRAAGLAHIHGGAMNLITSRGREATQSVFHLHVHLVPRKVDDGLALPWHSRADGANDTDAVTAAILPWVTMPNSSTGPGNGYRWTDAENVAYAEGGGWSEGTDAARKVRARAIAADVLAALPRLGWVRPDDDMGRNIVAANEALGEELTDALAEIVRLRGRLQAAREAAP